MANIKIPKRFQSLLEKDQNLDSIVKEVLSDFGEILKENRLYFFEEYTDHGIEHVEKVIFGANNLITDETFEEILNPKDICFFILGVVLHDIGMHISFEGFKLLINGAHDDIRIRQFDSNTWEELWLEYLSEAKRFSGKQLISIFGSDEITIRNCMSLDKDCLTGEDKKLVGEFIRRHHPRLAHEIAIFGFPGLVSSSIPFARSLTLSEKDITGLIARSHGLNLRACLEFIEEEFGRSSRKIPMGVHACYLMVLLRLADYLQIDNTRTSKISLKMKTLSSPISRLEHLTHLSIIGVDDLFQDDPENIYVETNPSNSEIYLKLKKLFLDIQYEFDVSWAVLGELYGKVNLGPTIKYRRISSNLDDGKFINKQQYVGDYFAFGSNDEIIKLLIKPLYGDDPTYGVRELLQNSVDACNERDELEKQGLKYFPEVNIHVFKDKQGRCFFRIKDNGVGMSVGVIKDYFLKAGASYRNSLEWKKKFLNDIGISKIQRNGKFGIGILACFLIGDKITVSTRGVNEKFGYTFDAGLSSSQINVMKSSSLNVGTEITIDISKSTLEKFRSIASHNGHPWTLWYTLKTPKINYYFLDKAQTSYQYYFPHYLDEDAWDNWSSFDCEGFDKVLWTYNRNFLGAALVCNGIVVQRHSYVIDNKKFPFALPKLSVFDGNNSLPISLNRKNLSDKVPFEKELLESIYKDYLAFLLCNSNMENASKGYVKLADLRITYGYASGWNGLTLKPHRDGVLNKLIFSQKGYILDYRFLLEKLDQPNLVYIRSNNFRRNSEVQIDMDDNFYSIDNENLGFSQYKRVIEQGSDDITKKTRVFYKKLDFEGLFDRDRNIFTKFFYDNISIDDLNEGWGWASFGNPVDYTIPSELLNNKHIQFVRVAPIIETKDINYPMLNSILQKYLGEDPVIPYEIKSRKEKFPLAFKELAPYMRKYLKNLNINS